MYRRSLYALLATTLASCGDSAHRAASPQTPDALVTVATAAPSSPSTAAASVDTSRPAPQPAVNPHSPSREPNELGRIPVLEYHLIGDSAKPSMWVVKPADFRAQLAMLYERGYRPVTVSEMVDRKIDLPAGLSPVVFTFDDASPSQFRYIERDGRLEIDPTSAVGIWLDFAKTHPGWANKATFCMLPTANAGHAFFGDKGIQGQKSEWRLQKVRWLAEQGFELCNHTLYHVNLGKATDSVVQEQIARGMMAIDSAVPGYRVRTFALPLGVWPRNKELAQKGSWKEPRTGRVVRYDFDAILLVAGGPARSPYDTAFSPLAIKRYIVFDKKLEMLLDELDRSRTRYVSDGDPRTVARPPVARGAGEKPGTSAGAR